MSMTKRSSAGAMASNGQRHGLHPPIEQYLETIYYLEEEGSPAIQARVAERVGHSAPTVSEMVHRLREAGYIEVEGRTLHMTAMGRHLATSVIRKHRLAERLLTDVIGLAWHKVHAEADRWEHVISDDVEQRLVDILDDPATCPHGNPIPGTQRPIEPQAPLSEALQGEHIRLTRVSEQVEMDLTTLAYLEAHGFVPGGEATVAARGPDGSLALDVAGETVELGPVLAQLLFYAPANDGAYEEPAPANVLVVGNGTRAEGAAGSALDLGLGIE
jgi:DtxR family transcriptional regulator, iron-dependent repressor